MGNLIIQVMEMLIGNRWTCANISKLRQRVQRLRASLCNWRDKLDDYTIEHLIVPAVIAACRRAEESDCSSWLVRLAVEDDMRPSSQFHFKKPSGSVCRSG